MKNFLKILLVLAALTGSLNASADEGMWMINLIDQALEKKMTERGLQLSAGEIYNADAPGSSLADAVVSMEFGCTGSIISNKGLLITNHHCAYGDIHRLSTSEHNYLEDGYWAMRSDEEKLIPGKSVWFLKRVLDVTEEVEALIAQLKAEGKHHGSRRVSHLMEKKYAAETTFDVILSSMWDGSKYYMAFYQVYRDIRLVAAPPVSMAAYGGDIDNWEWPQHKCDFAMYRVYTAPDGSPAEYSEENIPLKPLRKLDISLDGYRAGDFTMVIGYPGSTNRYSSSFEVNFNEKVKLPVSNEIRGRQMEIIKRWMDADPAVRLKYSDYYFGLSNVQEYNCGEVECFDRFNVVEKKQILEKDLTSWIANSGKSGKRWENLLEDLERAYTAVEYIERNLGYYRETLVRGTRISRVCYRKTREAVLKEYEGIDLRVEKELFELAVREFYSNVDSSMLGEHQKALLAEYPSYSDLAVHIWESSSMTDSARLEAFLASSGEKVDLSDDPLCRFLHEVRISSFNDAVEAAEGHPRRNALNKRYTQALYQMRLEKGEPQYPDANSTMRLTYGTVGGYEPYDGVVCDWKSTAAGILEKYNPSDYDFALNPRLLELFRGSGDMYVNFLTDNDITGGNSGSPVLNSRGELIGLAFDGNKESLAGDALYVEGYNNCVCVDIRYILWTLEHYMGLTRILEEMEL